MIDQKKKISVTVSIRVSALFSLPNRCATVFIVSVLTTFDIHMFVCYLKKLANCTDHQSSLFLSKAVCAPVSTTVVIPYTV